MSIIEFKNRQCSLDNNWILCGNALINGEKACKECLERQTKFERKCRKDCEKCDYADYSIDCFSGKKQFKCLCMDNID